MIGNVGISDVQVVTSSQVTEGRHTRWKHFDMPPPDTPQPVVITSPTDLSFLDVDPPPGTLIIIVLGHRKIILVPDSLTSAKILCEIFGLCSGGR